LRTKKRMSDKSVLLVLESHAFVKMRIGLRYTNKPPHWEYNTGRDCCWQGFM